MEKQSVYGGDRTQDISKKIAIDPTPEKATSHYLKTKFEEKVVKKKPEWDVPRVTPATELVVARRELTITDKALAEKREEEERRREEMDKEWEELEMKEVKLKESFARFNKFVKENQEKRERAQQKIEEELEIQLKLDVQIVELEERVEFMKSIREEMERSVKEYQIYEQFLFQVIQHADSPMTSSYDVLNRYETLASARAELAERQQTDLQALETARTEMIKLTDEKAHVIMGLNNALGELQVRYEKAKALTLRWETAVSRIKNISAEKTLELEQVRISCWNMYTAMCTRKNIEITISQDDIEEQLVFIKRGIQELKRVLKIVKKKAGREILTSRPVLNQTAFADFVG